MSEELQQKLRDQLWEVANKLRGNMSASDFVYFTLGFIFYKYLSEKIEKHANDALVDDEVTFKELWAMEKDEDVEALQEEVKTECLENIGYFIEYKNLFGTWLKPNSEFSVADLSGALNSFDRLISPNYRHHYCPLKIANSSLK